MSGHSGDPSSYSAVCFAALHGASLPYAYYEPPRSLPTPTVLESPIGIDSGAAGALALASVTDTEAAAEVLRPLHIILGHGLGAKNPASTGYSDDKWIKMVAEHAHTSGLKAVAYTARGHKDSLGWQATAESDLDQFTWRRLSDDMFSLATQHLSQERVVVGGSSMGSATALFCAMLNPPQHFAGLIMIRPPTAWETRRERRKFLISSANKCEQANPEGDPAHFVLRGAADADLPHTTVDVQDTYGKITCPVLILAVRNDDSHPLSTAEALHSVLPQSILHVAEDLDDARDKWPAIIRDFTANLS